MHSSSSTVSIADWVGIGSFLPETLDAVNKGSKRFKREIKKAPPVIISGTEAPRPIYNTSMVKFIMAVFVVSYPFHAILAGEGPRQHPDGNTVRPLVCRDEVMNLRTITPEGARLVALRQLVSKLNEDLVALADPANQFGRANIERRLKMTIAACADEGLCRHDWQQFPYREIVQEIADSVSRLEDE